jgi:hypothetical protein
MPTFTAPSDVSSNSIEDDSISLNSFYSCNSSTENPLNILSPYTMVNENDTYNSELIAALANAINQPRNIQLHHEPFHGKPSENFQSWLFNIDMQLRTSNLNEAAKICFVSQCLKDDARAWLQNEIRGADENIAGYTPIDTWQNLKQRLRHRFEPTHSHLRNEIMLISLEQTGSLTEYIDKFYALSSRLSDIAEERKVAAFIKGYRGPASTELIQRQPQTIFQCIEIAEEYEHLNIRRNQRPYRYQHNRYQHNRYQHNRYQHNHNQNNYYHPPIVNNGVIPMELGHIEEVQPVVCYKCGGINHTARFCLARPQPARHLHPNTNNRGQRNNNIRQNFPNHPQNNQTPINTNTNPFRRNNAIFNDQLNINNDQQQGNDNHQ